VQILWNKKIDEFVGDGRLAGIRLRDAVTDESSLLEVVGAFEAIGHVPNTHFLKVK